MWELPMEKQLSFGNHKFASKVSFKPLSLYSYYEWVNSSYSRGNSLVYVASRWYNIGGWIKR